MSTFPECDFFCNHVGRVSIVPSNCGGAESFIATDCTCEESPVTKNPTCLQSICAPQDFDSLVAAEEARCPGLVTRADQDELTADVVTVYRRALAATAWPREAEATALRQALVFESSPEQIGFVMINSTNAAHLGCGGGITSAVASLFVLVPVAFALLAVVGTIGAYKRRRAARVILEPPMLPVGGSGYAASASVGEKGWPRTA
ncbi:uncharacterized protein TRAVEDRAFT_51572 [Trametes versicolor FP-101664 SS1]|uniref:uncharacterized protein n=1 Tax=Trametes versicolor (strain FP-101664) TaxID=717944 RepID=UPI0004621AFE|nr:uncharacterized protein TRAVEDRAFT_51572 [Trametes versicolor FP-101664 SS1]EIW53832.1 hypothetical protein TRAVEDRAFT_51572 [Trametes versicolor FP-101664 SS1]